MMTLINTIPGYSLYSYQLKNLKKYHRKYVSYFLKFPNHDKKFQVLTAKRKTFSFDNGINI